MVDDIGADLVIARLAGRRPARQDMAWTATVASAWAGQALTVAALPRPVAYPCGPESLR
jgi:hypothetical protein